MNEILAETFEKSIEHVPRCLQFKVASKRKKYYRKKNLKVFPKNGTIKDLRTEIFRYVLQSF